RREERGERKDCSGERREERGERDLLHLAAHVEHFSTHPIAASLRQAYPDVDDDCQVSDVEEVAGQGIRARVNGQLVCVGNERMMQAIGASHSACHEKECEEHQGTVVHVSIDGQYAGHVVIADRVKDDAPQAISSLKSMGVARTVMLTGDNPEVAGQVARSVGVDECHAGLLPADKVEWVERLLQQSGDRSLAFVGDGINDAPVLARADVGIAMGALGSDAAVEAADVVIMDDRPSKVALAVAISRRTIAIARQNVVFAIAVKLLVLVLAALGLATMWMAVFADVGVTVLAVLNAMRAFATPGQSR
ncbi:MAG: HAD-IC family P-type ATPase, partial [Prevotella sp.]|nr:HAD-IC family P-type ATPase [Prevotella sp.]